jgi:hypothetical protein
MDFSFNIDLSGVKTAGPRTIAAGTYTVISDSAEIKATKSGTGEYISVKFKIVGGDCGGMTLWHSFNIKNQSVKAVEIGLQQLKQFVECSGAPQKLTSPIDLVGYKATAVVKIQSDATYGDKPVIAYFKPLMAEASGDKGSDVPF